MSDTEECHPARHRWEQKTNRYHQVYYECTRCGKVKGE